MIYKTAIGYKRVTEKSIETFDREELIKLKKEIEEILKKD